MDSTTRKMMDMLNASKNELDAITQIQEGNSAFTKIVEEVNEKAKEEDKVKAMKEKMDSLGANYILLSTVTGGRLPKSGLDHELYVYPKGTWTEDHELNIPKVDPFYYWDVELLEQMILCIKLQERGLLVGMPGTGKTSATKQLAAWRKQPFARFNGKEGAESSTFLGYAWAEQQIVTMKDGTEKVVPVMTFKEGLMPVAVREGYLTVIDEVMKLAPGIQMALQSLYEKGGFLMLDDKPGTIAEKQVHPHKDFLLYCTDNTCGTGDNLDLFAASQLQDTSTLDRFGITMEVQYLPRQEEVQMLGKMFPKVKVRQLDDFVKLAGVIRNAFKNGDLPVTLSPRGLVTMCGAIEAGLDWHHAVQIVYGNKLGEDSHVSKYREFVRTVNAN